jgi:hypothetical protein
MTTVNLFLKMSAWLFLLAISASVGIADDFDWSSSVPAEDTKIEALAVPLIGAESAAPGYVSQWDANRLAYQNAFVRLMSRQSSIQATPIKKSASFKMKKKTLKKLCTDVGADVALIGEFRGATIDFQIVAGYDGRVLSTFSLPVTTPINSEEVAKNTYTQFRAHVRYQGFIKATHGANKADISMGTKDGITPGSLLEAFDFVGNHPTFNSAQKSFGILQVETVTADSATVKVLTSTAKLRSNLKLRVIHVAGNAAAPVALPQVQAPAPTPFPTPASTPKPTPRVMPRATPLRYLPPRNKSLPTPQPTPRYIIPPPPPPALPAPEPEASYKTNEGHPPRLYSDKFWVSAGARLFGLNTQISSSSLASRQFQVSSAPMLELGLGYSRFNLMGAVGNLSNSSNNVSFIQYEANVQAYTILGRNFDYLTFVGVYGAQYTVSPVQGGTQILVTSNVISPFFEERFVRKFQNRNTLALAPRLYYPISSFDSADGAGSLSSSWGVGLEVAFQRHLSEKFGLDLGIGGHYFTLSLPQSQTVGETYYTFFGRLYLY